MKNLILAAFAALSLTAAIAPMANAALPGSPKVSYHTGPFSVSPADAGSAIVIRFVSVHSIEART
jgi:hypothetical protein